MIIDVFESRFRLAPKIVATFGNVQLYSWQASVGFGRHEQVFIASLRPGRLDMLGFGSVILLSSQNPTEYSDPLGDSLSDEAFT